MNTNIQTRLTALLAVQKKTLAGAAIFALLLGSFPRGAEASTWNPTLLVNTESFQIIDEGDATTDIELRFGDSVNERFYWDLSDSLFRITDDLFVEGALSGQSLRVSGPAEIHGTITASGAITTEGNLTINQNDTAADAILTFGNDAGAETLTFSNAFNEFEFSDDLRVTGGLSASGAVSFESTISLNSVIYTFPGSDGGSSGNVLATDSAGQLTWKTDASGTDWSGTGALQTAFDDRYVNQSGDTMTGALTIDVAGEGTTALSVSGAFIFNTSELDNDARFAGISDTNLFFLDASTDRVGIGTATPDTKLEVVGTMSGTAVHAEDSLSSSGTLAVIGTTRFQSATDATDFFQINDTDGGATIFNVDTTNERVGIGTAAPNERFTIEMGSNSDVFLMHSNSNVSAQISLDTNRTNANTNIGQIMGKWNGTNVAAMRFLSGDDTANDDEGEIGFYTAAAGGSFGERVRIDRDGKVGIGTSSPETELEVIGTISGTTIHAEDSLSASGAVSFDSTLSINNVVYTWPGSDGASSGQVLATDSAGQLTWKTDATSATPFGTGNVLTIGDDRYVRTAGDTMTGNLILEGSTLTATGITITGTGAGTEPLLSTDVEYGTIAMGTGGIKSGTGAMAPQLHIAGRVPIAVAGSLTMGGIPEVVYVQGRYAYVIDSTSDDLKVIDVSNPAYPVEVGSLVIGNTPRSISVRGRYAYIVETTDFQVIDVSNPASPVLMGAMDLQETGGGIPQSIFVQGQYAYIADVFGNDLKVIDVSNPEDPYQAGSLTIGNSPGAVYVQGRYAYVLDTDSNDLKVIDVSNPADPVLAGALIIGGGPVHISVQGKYAYVVDQTDGDFRVIDVSNPASPVEVGLLGIGSSPDELFVQGRYAYVVDSSSSDLKVIDISNPRGPFTVGSLSLGGLPLSVYVQGRYAYAVSSSTSDLKVIDLGGAYIQQLEAGGIETATLSVRTNASIFNDLDVRGGVNIGEGLYAHGPSSFYSSATGASVLTISGTGASQSGNALHIKYMQIDDADATDTSAGIQIDIDSGSSNADTLYGMNIGSLTQSGDGSPAEYALNIGTGWDRAISARGTISGSSLHADGTLSSSGAVSFDSTLSINNVVYTFPGSDGGSSGNVLATDSSGQLTWKTDATSATPFGTGNVITIGDARYVNQSGDTMTGDLILDGSTITATGGLFTGILSVSGAVSFESTISLNSVVYTFPGSDGGSSGNVLATDSAGQLTWKTDASGTDWSGTGALQTAFDDRYVNTSGDTMTGNLIIEGANLTATGITITGTGTNFSPTTATGTQQPLLTTDFAHGAIVMGTGAVKNGTGSMTPQLYVAGRAPIRQTGSGATGSAPNGLYVQGRYAYVVNSGNNTLQVFDVSNPAFLAEVGSVATGSIPVYVIVQGHYAYVVNSTSATLQIFDVSNPSSPTSVGTVATGTSPGDLYVQGRYAYVTHTGGTDSLQIFDVSNPFAPEEVGSVVTGNSPTSLYVQGRYAFVVNVGGSPDVLQIFDVSNSSAPFSVGSVAVGGNPNFVSVQGRYAYVVNGGANTLEILDISNPSSPTSVGTVVTGTAPGDLYVQGRYVYVTYLGGTDSLQIFDVSNPRGPILVGSVVTGASPEFIYVQGRYAYVTYSGGTDSLQIFDLGGAYIQQLEAGGIETSTLSVKSNASIFNNLDVRGGLTVGEGIHATGPSSVYASGSGTDAFVITHSGSSAAGADALSIDFTQRDDDDATDTGAALNIKAVSDSSDADLFFGVNIEGLVQGGDGSPTEYALNIGTGWDRAISARGTISGSSLHADGTLSASGAVSFESTISLNSVVYTFPGSDGGSSGQVLKTDSAGQLSWATDNDTGGSFLTFAAAEGIYVNQAGDTMTGALTIDVAGEGTTALSVSGAFIFNTSELDNDVRFAGVSDTNLFFLDASTNRIGIGTNAPEAKLEVQGTISGSTLYNATLSGTTIDAITNTLHLSGALIWYVDGDLTTGSGKSLKFTLPFAFTPTEVEVAVDDGGGPSGTALIIGIEEDDTTIFSTDPQIAAGAEVDDGNHVFNDTSLAAGAEITLEIRQIGSTKAGSGLTVQLMGSYDM